MRGYLVETYLPRGLAIEASGARQRARRAADDLARDGVAIRHVRTTLLPEDETCFHLFVADSEESVAEACRRAGLGNPRIVPAVEQAD